MPMLIFAFSLTPYDIDIITHVTDAADMLIMPLSFRHFHFLPR